MFDVHYSIFKTFRCLYLRCDCFAAAPRRSQREREDGLFLGGANNNDFDQLLIPNDQQFTKGVSQAISFPLQRSMLKEVGELSRTDNFWKLG